MNTRYYDKGYSLLHWATEIEAICPKCSCVGVISGTPYWKEWKATFFCQSCSHSLKTERDEWQGPMLGIGHRPCSHCGNKWVRAEMSYENSSMIKTNASKGACLKCKTVNEVQLTFTHAKPVDHAIDPFFGLELALKFDTRYGTVWAYGADHLEELKQYTSAQLREGNGMKWSYFTRLPKWLKTSKNRELVLKAIGKLEKRLVTKLTTDKHQ